MSVQIIVQLNGWRSTHEETHQKVFERSSSIWVFPLRNPPISKCWVTEDGPNNRLHRIPHPPRVRNPVRRDVGPESEEKKREPRRTRRHGEERSRKLDNASLSPPTRGQSGVLSRLLMEAEEMRFSPPHSPIQIASEWRQTALAGWRQSRVSVFFFSSPCLPRLRRGLRALRG